MKRDERLDKMKRTRRDDTTLRLRREVKTCQNGKNLKRGHDTPVKWISTKRTQSSQFKMMSEESNITKPTEQK